MNDDMNYDKKSVFELYAKAKKMEQIIDDYRGDISVVLSESCPSDERHCGCVPILRQQIGYYQNALVLIITAAEGGRVNDAMDIAREAIKNNFDIDDVSLSEARAVGEYWVNKLYELEDKYEMLQTEYADVCEKRLEAAEAFSKEILSLQSKIRDWEAYYGAITE